MAHINICHYTKINLHYDNELNLVKILLYIYVKVFILNAKQCICE